MPSSLGIPGEFYAHRAKLRTQYMAFCDGQWATRRLRSHPRPLPHASLLKISSSSPHPCALASFHLPMREHCFPTLCRWCSIPCGTIPKYISGSFGMTGLVQLDTGRAFQRLLWCTCFSTFIMSMVKDTTANPTVVEIMAKMVIYPVHIALCLRSTFFHHNGNMTA